MDEKEIALKLVLKMLDKGFFKEAEDPVGSVAEAYRVIYQSLSEASAEAADPPHLEEFEMNHRSRDEPGR